LYSFPAVALGQRSSNSLSYKGRLLFSTRPLFIGCVIRLSASMSLLSRIPRIAVYRMVEKVESRGPEVYAKFLRSACLRVVGHCSVVSFGRRAAGVFVLRSPALSPRSGLRQIISLNPRISKWRQPV